MFVELAIGFGCFNWNKSKSEEKEASEATLQSLLPIDDVFSNANTFLALEHTKIVNMMQNMICESEDAKVRKIVTQVRNSKHESIAHVLLLYPESFLHIFEEIIEKRILGSKELAELFLEKSTTFDSPLMLAIKYCPQVRNTSLKMKKQREALDKIWKTVYHCIVEKKIQHYALNVYKHNARHQNILHLCAEHNCYGILLEIAQCPEIPKADLRKALYLDLTESEIRNSPLCDITNQEVLIYLLERIINRAMPPMIQYSIFSNACKYNMNKVLVHFQKRNVDISILLKELDEQGNNGIMISAAASSDLVFLQLISYVYNMQDNEYTDFILHHKNNKGQTLLKIVLSQGRLMEFAIDILLKMERDYHRPMDPKNRDLSALMKCLQKNIGPCREVVSAIKQEKDFRKKSLATKLLSWMKVIFVTLLIPSTIYLIDVVTDSILTAKYHERANIKSFTNTSYESCKMDLWVQDLLEIPRGLNYTVCFNYSIAFMLAPIIFYTFEFLNFQLPKRYNKVNHRYISFVT